MSDVLEFTQSEPLTLGVELELQLLTTRDFDLTRGASLVVHAIADGRVTARNIHRHLAEWGSAADANAL